jgi:hypothetical protein
MISRPCNFRLPILDRLERRFRRSRPGSVLILVVALLVLLALLGTAYINTTQTDRYSSAQNEFNTEIDLLLQGVENMTRAATVNALFGSTTTAGVTTTAFHQDTTTTNPTQYAISDYPNNKPSEFIGDRYPSLGNPAASVSSSNYPYWNFISELPSLNNNPPFETPYSNTAGTGIPFPTPPGNVYLNRSQMTPYYLPVQVTDSSGTHTVNYPALEFQVANPNPLPPSTYLALAGDADGDGIADCALFRLPVGQINGVTYYAGVRVIDNAAALNAAIAWTPNPTTSPLPGNFFPTNIDLGDLLVAGDVGTNFTSFNTNARFNSQATPTPSPYDDLGNLRNDFSFATPYEAFWMQVGRRLANPGNYSTVGNQYTALPQSEMETMASRFILRDPSVTSTTYTQSSSSLEKYLFNSCVLNSQSTPYTPNNSLAWAQNNFDFANATAAVPLRSMLVTQNGVSNFTYSKLHNPGSTGATVATTPAVWNGSATYNFGDWVTYPTPTPYTDPVTLQSTTMTRTYVCMQQNTAQTPGMSAAVPPVPTPNAYWEPQPWTTGPTKASANTATFGQLWTAYYSAMTDTPITSTSLGGVTTTAYQAMFRASLRTVDPTTAGVNWNPTLTATGNTNTTGAGFPEMQLRAAIAAINTLQLRNPNSASPTAAPLSATINFTNASGAPAFSAIVYGSAPQPYITEVYANTFGGNAAQDYVAVELYNPYPFAITLTSWQLGTIARAPGATALTVTPLPLVTPWTGANAPTIAANGFLVLASAGTPPAATGITTPPTATVAASTLVIVPNLVMALNNELVLLRPAPATAGAPGTFFGTLTATVPVDSYDFTGLQENDPNPGHEWHYIRPNASAANGIPTSYDAWHFVYPGPYRSGASPSELGTKATPGPNPQSTSLAPLGLPDTTAAVGPPIYIDRPLQINNTGFAGANKATTATGNTFPYGGFARNADLLQVTYVGAYQITNTAGTTLYELNALPADSATADDPLLKSDLSAVTSEQLGRQNIGRFTPVNWADTIYISTPASPPTAPVYSPTYGTELLAYQAGHPAVSPPAPVYVPDDYWTQDTSLQTGYHWTFRLFDYVTVQSPQDDYLPDVDPSITPTPVYPGTPPAAVADLNKTIANALSTNEPSSATEETVPVHGRININTANWRVLATLPLFDNPSINQAAANELARAIIYYRDVDDGTVSGTLHPHGAFQSIEELNNVPVTGTSNPTATTTLTASGTTFRTAFGQYLGTFPVPGPHGSNIDGDLSNLGAANSATPDGVYGDFENQNLALNRISNLITTRSDSFTAYVIVQGWRNVGTTSPTLVVQRRGAFIIDRSTITPANNTQPANVNVPTE